MPEADMPSPGDPDLRELVLELQRQMENLNRRVNWLSGEGRPVDAERTTSRRDLLRLAGMGVAGAAVGAVALRPHGVAAADGSTMLVGNNNTTDNVANHATQLNYTSPPGDAGFATALYISTGQGYPPAATTTITGLKTRGIGGGEGAVISTDSGFGALIESNSGTGAEVTSISGTGVSVSTGSEWAAAFGSVYSVALNLSGTGRLSQILGTGGAAATAPNYRGDTSYPNPLGGQNRAGAELVRGTSGELWLAKFQGAVASDSNPQAYWRRINALRFDAADGSGNLFTPVRVQDTRSASPLAGGGTLNVQVAGVGGVPVDAIGVVGNLTAVSPSYTGYLTIFPTGGINPALTAAPTSQVNFVSGSIATPNAFICGLGSGQLSVFANGPSSAHVDVLVDITGYIQ